MSNTNLINDKRWRRIEIPESAWIKRGDIKVEYKREEAVRVEKNRDCRVCVKKEERW